MDETCKQISYYKQMTEVLKSKKKYMKLIFTEKSKCEFPEIKNAIYTYTWQGGLIGVSMLPIFSSNKWLPLFNILSQNYLK